MKYYIIRIITSQEKKFVIMANNSPRKINGRLIWPRRILSVKKAGIIKEQISSLYPGYLFWETSELNDESINIIMGIPGFVKFLKSNNEITPLNIKEKEIFSELIHDGEIIKKSLVVFDANNRIRVVNGPLKSLEGFIVKVDKRKGRAKVKLHLDGRSMLVDLGFVVMETVFEGRNYIPHDYIKHNLGA